MTATRMSSEQMTTRRTDETGSSAVVTSHVVAPTGPSRNAVARPVAATVLTVLGAVLLGFVADVTFLGGLRHHHDQQLRFASLRADLANAVAPVSAVDDRGHIYGLGTPVALLEIPRLGIREVVGEGTTSGVLISGPGHRRDTVLPGQPGTSVLMGRRTAFGGPFGAIGQLVSGDAITVTTGQGKQVFVVTQLRPTGAVAAPTLAGGAARLTLVTATGSPLVPTGTMAVDASLTSPVQAAPSSLVQAGNVTAAELPNHGDSSAWVRLVFWMQGLLVAAIAFTIARVRWGRWQAWISGIPLLVLLGVEAANQAATLLPNLT